MWPCVVAATNTLQILLPWFDFEAFLFSTKYYLLLSSSVHVVLETYISMLRLWCTDPILICFKQKLTLDLTLQHWWTCLQKLWNSSRQTNLEHENCAILDGSLPLMMETTKIILWAQKLHNALSQEVAQSFEIVQSFLVVRMQVS